MMGFNIWSMRTKITL